jgi:ABC-type cobalt transport system substrate-binding protein
MIPGPPEEMEEGELEEEDSSTAGTGSVQKGGRQTVPNPLYTPASDEVERKGKTLFLGFGDIHYFLGTSRKKRFVKNDSNVFASRKMCANFLYFENLYFKFCKNLQHWSTAKFSR